MELLIFLLLVTIGGSSDLGFFGHCNINQCDSQLPPEFVNFMRNFPPNEIQLKDMCPPLLRLMNCYTEVVLDCTGETFEELATSDNATVSTPARFINNLINLNKDICNEETELSKNYLENIQCFKEMLVQDGLICRKEGERLYEAYRLALPYTEEDEEESLSRIMSEAQCMTMAYELACTKREVQNRCGDTASAVYREVVRRLQILKLGICSEGELQSVREKFVAFLQERGEHPHDFMALVLEARRRRK